MRRVHVLGAGSLGSLFASHFARANVETTMLLRPRAAHIAGVHCTVRVTEKICNASGSPVELVDEQL